MAQSYIPQVSHGDSRSPPVLSLDLQASDRSTSYMVAPRLTTMPTNLLVLVCSQLAFAAATPPIHGRDDETMLAEESVEPMHNGLDSHWVVVIIVLVVVIVGAVVGICIWAKMRQRRRLRRGSFSRVSRRISSASVAPLQEKSPSPSLNANTRQSPIPEPMPALTYDGPYRGFNTTYHGTR
ncbi:hypothetical protein BDY19DRAFT_273769 [Irpex rosettiformis]|uniref:Uncharacterized protein n=1 Tax=Irpex rosettiformis TaxID=378272 RepID=A0ACB8UI82_9APHY|nr:hypothetical protein BDY19DRAFT_273769 [Irpex rosettiformis]